VEDKKHHILSGRSKSYGYLSMGHGTNIKSTVPSRPIGFPFTWTRLE